MQAQDVFIRLTDPSGKSAPITSSHRVWDRERFLTAQIDLHSRRAQGEDQRIVSLVTEADYRRSRGYKTI